MNKQRVRIALTSVRDFEEILNSLTREELEHVLEVESQASRRPVLMRRAISRLTRLHADEKRQELKERYFNGA